MWYFLTKYRVISSVLIAVWIGVCSACAFVRQRLVYVKPYDQNHSNVQTHVLQYTDVGEQKEIYTHY
mgnify:CR=1 FL=1